MQFKYTQTIIRFSVFLLAAFAPYFLLGSSGSSAMPTRQPDSAQSVSNILPKAQAAESVGPEHYTEPAGVPILMYHHVGDFPADADGTRRDLTVSTADFAEQVKWLKNKGYTSISLKQLYESRLGKFVLPVKPVVFTFDDGYSDVFENAVPVLVNNGYIGSFAIITSFPGQGGYATWDQIKQAQTLGMEIVSHTQDHFDGSNTRKYNLDFIYANLVGSKKALADQGINTDILVYPYGHYTPEYIEKAQQAGFVMALTVAYGRFTEHSDLMRVSRVRVHGNETLQRFEEILMGRLQVKPTSTTRQSPAKSL